MNYSNMIEEKNLKKTFIIATLVSTLVGTFTTSLGLYERIGQYRKQKKTDNTQDDKIKELEKKMLEAEKRYNEPRPRSRSPKRLKSREDRDELEDSLEMSGPLIRREFNGFQNRMGSRFAIGDAITQNQLQAQIIALQQTVIGVLEEAVYNNSQPTPADVRKLFNASEAAREGSLHALSQQYQRMAGALPLPRAPSPARSTRSIAPRPPSPAQSTRTTRTEKRIEAGPASSSPSLIDTSPLFCRYALDLQQNPRMALAPSFQPNGSGDCPACHATLGIETGRAWRIVKDVEHSRVSTADYDDIVMEEKTFHLGNPFVVKCHRENGQFACVLCNRNRSTDTIWESLGSFVKHVWRAHDVEEYAAEVDIRELGA